MTQNFPFKALNINAQAFKAAAASKLIHFIPSKNECVSDDMASPRTAIRTVLYIQQLCNQSTISESTVYPTEKNHSQLQWPWEG